MCKGVCLESPRKASVLGAMFADIDYTLAAGPLDAAAGAHRWRDDVEGAVDASLPL